MGVAVLHPRSIDVYLVQAESDGSYYKLLLQYSHKLGAEGLHFTAANFCYGPFGHPSCTSQRGGLGPYCVLCDPDAHPRWVGTGAGLAQTTRTSSACSPWTDSCPSSSRTMRRSRASSRTACSQAPLRTARRPTASSRRLRSCASRRTSACSADAGAWGSPHASSYVPVCAAVQIPNPGRSVAVSPQARRTGRRWCRRRRAPRLRGQGHQNGLDAQRRGAHPGAPHRPILPVAGHRAGGHTGHRRAHAVRGVGVGRHPHAEARGLQPGVRDGVFPWSRGGGRRHPQHDGVLPRVAAHGVQRRDAGVGGGAAGCARRHGGCGVRRPARPAGGAG